MKSISLPILSFVLLLLIITTHQAQLACDTSRVLQKDNSTASREDKNDKSKAEKAKALETFTLYLLKSTPVMVETENMPPELIPICIDHVEKKVDAYALRVKNDRSKKNKFFNEQYDELAGKLERGELEDYLKEVIRKNWNTSQK